MASAKQKIYTIAPDTNPSHPNTLEGLIITNSRDAIILKAAATTNTYKSPDGLLLALVSLIWVCIFIIILYHIVSLNLILSGDEKGAMVSR